MNATHRIIVHGLMKIDNKYLLLKRTQIKRGKPNVYPEYWDIPGGLVEAGELPKDALIREAKEEVNLNVKVKKILQEDSNLDKEKNIVFTRLVYACDITNKNIEDIKLQMDEHDDYKLINSLDEMSNKKIVNYVENLLKE